MSLNFTYTKEDYVDSRRKYLFMSKTITKPSLFLAFALLLIEIYLLTQEITGINIALGVCLLFYVTLFFILYVIQPGMIFNKTDKLQHEYFLNFTDTEIIFRTQNIDSKLKWDIYKELWENDKYYYLLQDKNVYTLIPKRVFENEEAIKQFKDLFIKSTPDGKYILFG